MAVPVEEHVQKFDEKKVYAPQEDNYVSWNQTELSHVKLNSFQV